MWYIGHSMGGQILFGFTACCIWKSSCILMPKFGKQLSFFKWIFSNENIWISKWVHTGSNWQWVQVMAWCFASMTSLFLDQCWPRFLKANGITRPQWINSLRPADAVIIHLCEMGQHWCRIWLVACVVPSHYRNQWWLIVDWTHRSTLQWSMKEKWYKTLLLRECHLFIGKYHQQILI